MNGPVQLDGRTECAVSGGVRYTLDSLVEAVGVEVVWTKRTATGHEIDPSMGTYDSVETALQCLRAALENPSVVRVELRFDKAAHPLCK